MGQGTLADRRAMPGRALGHSDGRDMTLHVRHIAAVWSRMHWATQRCSRPLKGVTWIWPVKGSKTMITTAARHQDVHMARQWQCPHKPRSGACRPAWFNEDSRSSKANLKLALVRGVASHAYQQMRWEHKTQVRRVKRETDRHRVVLLIDRLQRKDREAFNALKRKETKTICSMLMTCA